MEVKSTHRFIQNIFPFIGNAQYQTVKTISKSVEEVADKFKDTYMEAEAVIESYEVMRQRNVAIKRFNNESEADNNFQDEQVNQIDDTLDDPTIVLKDMEQITSTVSVEVQTEDADAHTQSNMITSSQMEEVTRINDSIKTLDNTAQITSSASIFI